MFTIYRLILTSSMLSLMSISNVSADRMAMQHSMPQPYFFQPRMNPPQRHVQGSRIDDDFRMHTRNRHDEGHFERFHQFFYPWGSYYPYSNYVEHARYSRSTTKL